MPVLTAAEALTLFALCAAGLVLLFLLRQRAKRVVVPTLAPWREGRPRRIDPLWRELAALLLQILAVGLICAALTPPEQGEPGAPEMPGVVIIDGSASMRAAGRIEAARATALALGGGLIVAGERPKLLLSPDASPNQRQMALTRVEAGFGGADIDGALAMARANGWVPTVLSDHAPEDAALPWRVVGSGGPDALVESVLASAGPGLPPEHAVSMRVVNHGPARPARLRLEGAEGIIGEEEVVLPADDALERTWRVDPIPGDWVKVSIVQSPDALPEDDVGYALLPPLRPAEVWLLGPGNRYVEGVFRLMPGLRLRSGGSGAQPDLVVFDRSTPRRVPEGAAVALIDPPMGAGPLPPRQTVSDPVFTSWDYGHPLLRGVALRQLAVEEVSVLSLPRSATVIASVAEGPVIAMPEDGPRTLVMGFDLTRSDLPLSIAFPQLIYNLVLWARHDQAPGPTAAAERAPEVNAWAPVTLTRLDTGEEASWDGAASQLVGLPPGVWSLSDGLGVRLLTTSFDASEFASPLDGQAPPSVPESPEAPAQQPRFAWIGLVAFIVLLAEFGVAPR